MFVKSPYIEKKYGEKKGKNDGKMLVLWNSIFLSILFNLDLVLVFKR
jgi:hypothetical protein